MDSSGLCNVFVTHQPSAKPALSEGVGQSSGLLFNTPRTRCLTKDPCGVSQGRSSQSSPVLALDKMNHFVESKDNQVPTPENVAYSQSWKAQHWATRPPSKATRQGVLEYG
jgi:hypothetical protein